MTYHEFAIAMKGCEELGYEDGVKRLAATYPKLYKLWLHRVGH